LISSHWRWTSFDEARELRKRFDASLPAFSAIGYREAWDVLDGRMTLDDAIALNDLADAFNGIPTNNQNVAELTLEDLKDIEDVFKTADVFIDHVFNFPTLAEGYRAWAAGFALSKEGRAVTIYVSGASGIGKTALVRASLDRLAIGNGPPPRTNVPESQVHLPPKKTVEWPVALGSSGDDTDHDFDRGSDMSQYTVQRPRHSGEIQGVDEQGRVSHLPAAPGAHEAP
jgi:hypothetical protein